MNNNNESMQTVVETFFVEETLNLVHNNEALTKWNEKVEELGLEGQKSVVQVGKSPIPFLWMNASMINTFTTLCPTKEPVAKYSKTPIPVELLEVISLCQKEGYFDEMKVWYNERDKDPVIVGYKWGEYSEHDWGKEAYSKKYLIGRWADVKASLDSLIVRAKKIFFESKSIELKKEIRNKQRELEDLESTMNDTFGGGMPLTDNLPF